MNAKIQAAQKKAKRAELAALFPSDVCKVASLGVPGKGRAGTVTEVNIEIAARVITEGTHRLATAEEIASHDAQMAERRASHGNANNAVAEARARFRALMDSQQQERR